MPNRQFFLVRKLASCLGVLRQQRAPVLQQMEYRESSIFGWCLEEGRSIRENGCSVLVCAFLLSLSLRYSIIEYCCI